MNPFNRLLLTSLASIALVLPGTARAAGETTSTLELVTQAVTSFPSCSQWHVSGVCFWLKCSPFGCSVRTSVRFSHLNPDVVVSTYHDIKTHPWPETGALLSSVSKGIAQTLLSGAFDSAGTHTRGDRTDMQRRFLDADAVGHPATALSWAGYITCPSVAMPLQPYFQSTLDALVWRALLPVEMLYPASWIPGMREIGMGLTQTWGNVFPRQGDVVQQHPVKAAAVMSQRAADIITNTGQPHVYVNLPSGGTRDHAGYRTWMPPPAREASAVHGLWQMSAPTITPAALTCEVFGKASFGPLAWGDYSTSGSDSYAFTYWRPYACCRYRGKFIGAIQWGRW